MVKISKLGKKLTLAALILALASAPNANAQEVRDPNQAPKKFEAAVGVRNLQGYAGRVWVPDPPYLVGEIAASTKTEFSDYFFGGYFGEFTIQGSTWFGWDPRKGNSEMDLVGTIIKEFKSHKGKTRFALGLQGAVYSIPLHGESEPNSNLDIIARIPISKNWGVSFTKDVRKLSSYSIGTGYKIPLEDIPLVHEGSLTFRGEFRNSYTFGPTGNVTVTLGADPFYLSFQGAKGFRERENEEPLPKLVKRVEAGVRWQF